MLQVFDISDFLLKITHHTPTRQKANLKNNSYINEFVTEENDKKVNCMIYFQSTVSGKVINT